MRDVNKVILRGVVSDAPQSRMVGDGTRKLVNLTVKTVTMESDDEGALRERPAWHRVDVWGDKFGEIAERLAPIIRCTSRASSAPGAGSATGRRTT